MSDYDLASIGVMIRGRVSSCRLAQMRKRGKETGAILFYDQLAE
jgi:hypothetical protein